MARDRRLVIAAFVFAAIAVAGAAEPERAPAPSLEATDLVYDAGKVSRGVKVTHVFVLKNVGGSDFPIRCAVNSAVGYRARQIVDIKPGQILKMSVKPPDGRVSVNAIPWAQVWINGSLVGDTPIANLPLAAGEHQITFRHPQLGEQTQRVMVRTAAVTRVSATFAR